MSEIISIICPVYNCEKHITQCVESVINQTSNNWELILVDDGSTDNSKKLCDSFSQYDERIKVIHKKNEGQMNARIDGIKAAKGERVIFLDSDDYLNKNIIQVLEKSVISNFNTDAFVFNATVFPKTYSKQIPEIRKETVLKGRKDIFQFAFGGQMFGYLWMYCFKREILLNAIEINNPLKEIRYTEDAAFVFNVLSCCNLISTLTTSLYFYRDNPDSITHNLSLEDRRDRFLVYGFIYSNIHSSCDGFVFDNNLCIHISWILFSYLEHQNNKNDLKKAFKECRNGFIFNYVCRKAKTTSKKFKLYRFLLRLNMPSIFYRISMNKND